MVHGVRQPARRGALADRSRVASSAATVRPPTSTLPYAVVPGPHSKRVCVPRTSRADAVPLSVAERGGRSSAAAADVADGGTTEVEN